MIELQKGIIRNTFWIKKRYNKITDSRNCQLKAHSSGYMAEELDCRISFPKIHSE